MFRRTAALATTMRDPDFNDRTTTLGLLLLAALAALVALSGCRNVTPADDDTAPSFGDATVPDQTYTVGVEIESQQLPAATGGNGELTYALAPAVPGLSFDAATRTLGGTAGEAGTYAMTYTATDADDNTDAADAATLTFTITVEQPDEPAPVNLAPESIQGYVVSMRLEEFDIIGDGGGIFDPKLRINEFQYIEDGRAILARHTVNGEDDFTAWRRTQPLRWEYTVISPTVGQVEIFIESRGEDDPNTTLTLTFADETSGTWEDFLHPNDRYPGGIRFWGTFTIRDASDDTVPPAPNQPPVVRIEMEDRTLTAPGGEGVIAVRFEVAPYFRDPDGDPLTFAASSSDETVATAVVNAENELRVAAVAPGTATVTVTATDPSGASIAQEFEVTVEPAPNLPPYVRGQIEAPTLQAGVMDSAAVSYQLNEYFGDPNGDLLIFEASSSDETVATSAVDAEDVLTVAAVGPGQATITVTATDPSGASATQEFEVTVMEEPPPITTIANTYRGHGDEVFHLNPDGAPLVHASYTLELGSASPEVYLIATNTNAYRASSTIERLDQAVVPDIGGAVDESRLWQRSGPRAWRPQVSEFNNNPPLGRAVAPGISYSRPSRSQAGDRHTFLDLDNEWNVVSVPATARRVVDDGTRTLTVWVADASWGSGCALSACVQQAMVDAIAERFLRSGAGNDIHDWLVAVFGDPWGPHEADYLIPPEAASELHILVFDIDGDDEEGGALGFYWAKDAFVRDPSSELPRKASNERLMFYMDAVWLADPDGPTWEVTDYGRASC